MIVIEEVFQMKPRSFDEIIEEVARQLNTTPDSKLPPLERFVECIVLMAQEEK